MLFHSRIILRAVINCISLLITSSTTKSSAALQYSRGRAAAAAAGVLTQQAGFLQLFSLMSCNAQACTSQAEDLVAALIMNFSHAHELPPQKMPGTEQRGCSQKGSPLHLTCFQQGSKFTASEALSDPVTPTEGAEAVGAEGQGHTHARTCG